MKHLRAEGATSAGPPPGADRLAAIRAGNRAAVARAISEIENGLPSAEALLAGLAGDIGRAHVLGITGVPGAGKSTLINALLADYTARGHRVAVVAVDPSSPITGGAVLGDRIRMAAAGAADSVFIRSLASRGHPGGVSHATRGVVDVLDAAGFDTIIVETVGAGQSEVDIAALADTSVVVCPPGLGDSVQAIKAGILEIADVLVVNKSDLPDAARTAVELAEMLRLRKQASSAWSIPVLRTTATTGEGVAALVDAAIAHAAQAERGRRLRGAPGVRRHAEAAPRQSLRPDAASEGAEAIAGDVPECAARVRRLAAHDPFLRHNGIECIDAGPGTAILSLHVRTEHLNFNGSCHGGAIFALADSAFGLASNSRGAVCAGVDAHITYHVAVREGDTLTAWATEVSRSARLAVYRIDVARGDGTLVSSFTGTVFVTRRRHTDEFGS